MKRVVKTRRTVSKAVNGKASKWTARSTAAQSTVEINERCRAAIADATIAVEDARVSIAESNALSTKFDIRYPGRRL